MMRSLPVAALLLGLAACSGEAPRQEQQQAPAPAAAPQPEDVLVMSGIDLYLHDASPTGGGSRKPSFWVHAETFSQDDAGQWAFEQARAVVFNQENEQEDITFEAARGTFRENEAAFLTGGVVAHMGTMTIKLDEIEWRNATAEAPTFAQSNSPLVVDDPDIQLEAVGIHIYPDTRSFQMKNVSGVIRFGSKINETTPADLAAPDAV